MKKRIIAGILLSTLLIGGTASASAYLYQEEINQKLIEHKEQLVMNISRAESNVIANYVSELEEHKLNEIERGKEILNAAAQKSIEEMGKDYQSEIEKDKQAITDYVNKRAQELSGEIAWN